MFLPTRCEDEDWLGVLIAVPEPWVSQITEARLALGDKAAAQIPAHITLIPPIAVKSDEREAVFAHLRLVVKRHHPFRISIRGTDTFMPISPSSTLLLRMGHGPAMI